MTTKLENLPDNQLMGCYWSRLSRASDLEGEALALRDEADEIAGMLTARGYRRQNPDGSGEWVK